MEDARFFQQQANYQLALPPSTPCGICAFGIPAKFVATVS